MSFDVHQAETLRTLQALSGIRPAIDAAAKLVLDTLRHDKKLLICGNGGSAAEAAHFATELTGRYAKHRVSLPAIALSSDGTLLSCIGNDFGFEQVFARQIAAHAHEGDLVVVISSSGNSPNLVAALHEAKACGAATLALLGRGGGKCRGLAQVELVVPGESGRTAQEAHLFLIHHFCELIDTEFA
jgi:D-sedoheptulose 7-phosphate isomerase